MFWPPPRLNRTVEEDHFGVADEGHGDEECAHLPAGELRGPDVRVRQEAHHLHPGVRLRLGMAAPDPLDARDELQVLPHRQPLPQRVVLRAKSKAALDFVRLERDAQVAHEGVAAGRTRPAGEDGEDGGLASACGKKQGGGTVTACGAHCASIEEG